MIRKAARRAKDFTHQRYRWGERIDEVEQAAFGIRESKASTAETLLQ